MDNFKTIDEVNNNFKLVARGKPGTFKFWDQWLIKNEDVDAKVKSLQKNSNSSGNYERISIKVLPIKTYGRACSDEKVIEIANNYRL